MKKIKFLLFAVLLFLVTPSVMAKEVDHFVSKADNNVEVNNVYNSSVAVAGDNVTTNGSINGLAFVAGNKVTIEGDIEYGVIAGNNIIINSNINKDAFIAGNIITIDSDSNFQRDAIIAGSDVVLSGTFNRNVSLYAANVTLKNVSVKENVKIYGQNVTVSDGTVIEGTLYYPEDSQYKKSGNVSINAITKTPAIQTTDEENYFATISAKIWSFFGMALVFAAMSLFFPGIFNNINEKYAKFEVSEGVEVFTKGLVVLILVPVVSILLFFTMIGIQLSVVLLVLYGLAIYLTKIFVAYLIGYKIWQKVFDKDAHILFFGLIGLFILLLLALIPGVRTLVSILTVIVGLGLIFDTIRKQETK